MDGSENGGECWVCGSDYIHCRSYAADFRDNEGGSGVYYSHRKQACAITSLFYGAFYVATIVVVVAVSLF